jgi:hypothetical protein
MLKQLALWRARTQLRLYVARARVQTVRWAIFSYRPIAGADGEGGGSGSGSGSGEGGEGGSGSGSGSGSGGGSGSGSGGQGSSDKTFTQAELDRIVQERVARAEGKFKDYDELKAAKAQLDKIQEGQQSELEKANKRAEAAETKAQEQAALSQTRLRQAAIMAAGSSQNALKPEHLYRLMETSDLEKVTVGDDGQVTGAEDAVKAFLEANPEYVRTAMRTRAHVAAVAELASSSRPTACPPRRSRKRSRRGVSAITSNPRSRGDT